MPRVGVGHYVSRYASGGFDPSAQAFFAATGITGATQQQAINNLVVGLKADGLWSKMKALYPFVTDNRNLLGYTEDFGNGVWGKNGMSVTTNTTTAPDGTTTADTFQNGNTSAYLVQSNVALLSATYTQSCYIKKNNNDYVAIYTSDGGSNYAIAYFNINTGVKGTVSAIGNFSSATSTIISVGNGWYRCSLTFTKPSSGVSETSHILPTGDNTFTRVVGQNGYIWGAQLELGSTATTYQPIATTQQSFIANQFKYNLVNPVDSDAAFRLVFNGGWTFSSNGATPNGTNGYADTKFVPSSNLVATSQASSIYSRSNTNNGANPNCDFSGAKTGVGNFTIIAGLNTVGINGFTRYGINTDVRITTAQRLDGYFVGSRTGSTTLKLWRSNTLLGTQNTSETGICDVSPYIGAENVSGVATYFTNRQYCFAHAGDGLTDTEASNLYTRVQAYQTALNRQITP